MSESDDLMHPDCLAHGLPWSDIESIAAGPAKAAHYLANGLFVQGGHHKQWCIEQALTALGVDLQAFRAACDDDTGPPEEGIAP